MSVSKFHSNTFSSIFTVLLLVFGLFFPLLLGCDTGAKLVEKAQNAVRNSSITDEENEEEEYVVIELNAPKKTENVSENTKETKIASLPETVTKNTAETVTFPITSSSPTQKKNVILMIADGAGFGSFYATADFMTGSPTGLFYQKMPWKNASVATFHKKSFYEPEADWKEFKNLHIPFYEKEAAFIPPESASTGTAMMTGVKTRNGRIGIGPNDEKLTTIAEIFHQNGYRTGAVTSFQIASATMATVVAHSLERKEGQKILSEMLSDGNLDVIIGAGHPEYDDDGTARAPVFGKYGPSEKLWEEIQAGNLPEYRFIEKRTDFQALAEMTPDKMMDKTPSELPSRILGIAPVANSFQCHRSADIAQLSTSPTLSEVALTALNVLAFMPKNDATETGELTVESFSKTTLARSPGFFLMIESGAVDVANDAQNLTRCVEEMTDFNNAVSAVCAWVEKYSSWEETLLIVTADHDNGAIYGPDTDAEGIPISAPIYRGKGNLPKVRYYADDHTKQLVPIYVRGAGAEILDTLIIGTDARMGNFWDYDGRYIDNTAIFRLMMNGLNLSVH